MEDSALLSGAAQFVDDLDEARNALHLVVLRSPVAHAEVRLGASGKLDGIRRMLCREDVAGLSWPQLLPGVPPLHPLAQGRARYQGQPIAAAVAESARIGLTALEALDVDYRVLAAATTTDDAVAPDAPLVYEELGSNVAYEDESVGRPTEPATGSVVVRRRLRMPRVAPGMLECRALLAVPDDDGLLIYASHQSPHKLRDELAALLDLDRAAVRVVAPAVGGGFGAKSSFYPEYALTAFAALELGEPVKYVESRRENLLHTAHGRGQVQDVTLVAAPSGRLVSLDVSAEADFGAAVDLQRWCIALTRLMLAGAYRIPEITWRMRGVLTHTPPVGAFRGAGRPEAAYLLERMMDELARALGMDPVELRLANFVDAADFPHRSAAGANYDSGDYATALRAAVNHGRYRTWIAERDQRRRGGRRQLGVGVASYVEMSAGGGEYGAVTLDSDGNAMVRTGTSPHGQGHETAWSQLVADDLGLSPERVLVVHGDTAAVRRGGGTSGSRSAALGGSAIALAGDRVARRLRELAARALEASVEDIELQAGYARVSGTDVGIEVGALAASEPGGVIGEEASFEAPGQNFPFGSVVCVVEVDTETGEITVVSYTSVVDCGRVINPMLVEGQLHGGVLQGASLALREEVLFDEAGALLTGNLAAYHLPGVRAMLEMTLLRTETASPNNPLGVKGVGELGTTGATPAIANAVVDALAGLEVDTAGLQIPFTPQRVWTALARGA